MTTMSASDALADAERLRGLLEAGRSGRLDSDSTMTAERAEHLVDEVRATRAGR